MLSHLQQLGIQRQMRRQLDEEFLRIPFKLDNSQVQFLSQIEKWWQSEGQLDFVRVISHPFNQKSCIVLIYWLISKISNGTKPTNLAFLVDSISRANLLQQIAKYTLENYFSNQPTLHLPRIGTSYRRGKQINQIIFMSMKQFVRQDLPYDHVYNAMLIEASNFTRMVGDSFKDYITDTYLRRSYIEAMRYQQAYKMGDKSNTNKISNKNAINREQSVELKQIPLVTLVSLQSNESNLQRNNSNQAFSGRQRPGQIINTIQPPKKTIKKTYETKKQMLIKSNKKQKNGKTVIQGSLLFDQNQLILISTLIYLIGFFYHQIQSKKVKNLYQFLTQFQNKTCLKSSLLDNVKMYCEQIYKNCPIKLYDKLEQTYLYSFCRFLDRLVSYRRIFQEDYFDLFEVRSDKFPFQRRQSIIQQSTCCIMIEVQDNYRIHKSLLNKKSLNSLIIQNFAAPDEYWNHVFKKRDILLSNQLSMNQCAKIYGLQISKTSSNQDFNFAEKSKSQIQKIKLKACGVLLYDLSKFVPDGIIVYFNSLEGLQSFNKEMESQDEKILKKIDKNKKIFYQSIFQQQNNQNFNKFKKCCQIGRGAIFFMAANGKAAQHLKFYNHLSRCIVFFGMPKKQAESKRQKLITPLQIQQNKDPQDQKENLESDFTISEKICLINQCLNNCINDLSEYKSVIFVGAQITNDLQDWYKQFIKSWAETSKESLMKLRHHFQKMGSFLSFEK